MALARLYLNYQGALRNQIVVPLDAHLELFHSVRRYAEEIGELTTLRRTDLALFDLDLARRTITCNLVEVKCYAENMGLSGYGQVKERITEQLNQSERILQQHSTLAEQPRIDRTDYSRLESSGRSSSSISSGALATDSCLKRPPRRRGHSLICSSRATRFGLRAVVWSSTSTNPARSQPSGKWALSFTESEAI